MLLEHVMGPCDADAGPNPSESVFSLSALESKLVSYMNEPDAVDVPFDIASVPKVSRAQAQQEGAREFFE